MKYIYPLNNANNSAKIMQAAEHHLLWFEQLDMAEWLTGDRKRVKAVEYHLPRLVAQEKLLAVRYDRKLVYRLNHAQCNGAGHLTHDLMCTQIILRFAGQDAGEIVSELFFLEEKKLFGCVPDWAVLFPSLVLLCEYSTGDNFRRTRTMRGKLKAYRHYLFRFIDYFDSAVSVLFIFDVPRYKVQQFVASHTTSDDTPFYFTDLASLLAVPKDGLLTSPLFIWGGDGKSYPLKSND